MRYFLSKESVLRLLEKPAVYHVGNDDLYELDDDAFKFLKRCETDGGCEAENDEFIDYCLKEEILTRCETPPKHSVLMKSPEPSLRYLELQITNRCNLECRHCYIEDNDSADLSAAQIRDILKEFEQMQGLRALITGGEPLLHREFRKINEMLPDFLMRKILFTNGLLLTEGTLKKLNVDEIQISIDGFEDAHDSLRGKGTFRSAIGAVKRALSAGFEVSVATMVHPINLDDFEGMERLFKDLGIKDWTVDIPCVTGRLEKHIEFHISPEYGGKYLRYGYGKGLHSGSPGFACGLHLAAVMADGRVSKCTFYANSFAGRIEDGLRECWKKFVPVRLDSLSCDCEYLESCRGGCRYRAELLGDARGKDFYRCALYDILKKRSIGKMENELPL